MALRITSMDEDRFTHGDCWILAEELYKLTGWPLAGLDDGDEDGIGNLHAFVLTPHGTALDIYGERSQEAVVAEWAEEGAVGVVPMKPGDFRTYQWDEGGYYDAGYSRRRAKKIAKHLVNTIGKVVLK